MNYQIKIVYNNNNDRRLLDLQSLESPIFIDYMDYNTSKGRKDGSRLKAYYGARKFPFIEVLDENNKFVKAFYSEEDNAVNQLIKFLNESTN